MQAPLHLLLAFHGFEQQEILIGGGADRHSKCELDQPSRSESLVRIEVNIADSEANSTVHPNTIVQSLPLWHSNRTIKAARIPSGNKLLVLVASLYNYKKSPPIYICRLAKSTTPDR